MRILHRALAGRVHTGGLQARPGIVVLEDEHSRYIFWFLLTDP